MFSKVFFVVFFGLAILGCANDHNFKKEDLVVSLNYDSSCIDKVSGVFKKYKTGVSDADEVGRSFDCILEALDYIPTRIKPSLDKAYSTNDLENFMNRFVFKDDLEQRPYFKGLLTLKSVFFGGATNQLSFQDIKKIRSEVVELKALALEHMDAAPALFFKKSSVNPKKVDQALLDLNTFVYKLLEKQNQDLVFANLESALENSILKSAPISSWISVVNLASGKKFDEPIVKFLDQKKTLDDVFSYYRTFIDLFRSLETNWESQRQDYLGFESSIDKILLELEKSISLHVDKSWSFEALKAAFGVIDSFDIFDKTLSKPAKDHIVEVVFTKYFKSNLKSLDLQGVAEIKNYFAKMKSFIRRSKQMEGYVGPSFPVSYMGQDYLGFFTRQKWPNLVDTDRVYFISDESQTYTFSFQALFHVAWQYMVSDILLQAYDKGFKSGLSLEEVKEAYLDIFVFLKEIEFLDDKSLGSWFRIFNEGNLLVPSAQPDDKVDVTEIAEYLGFTFSAVNAGSEIFNAAKAQCRPLTEACALKLLRTQSQTLLFKLPGLVRYFSDDLGDKDFDLWQRSFEYIAKLADDDLPYTTSHWLRGTVANQYVEVLFKKYDQDSSDTMNLNETKLAYEDFKFALRILPQIQGTAAETNDSILKAFFTFFVRYGRIPEIKDGKPTKEFFRYYLRCGLRQGKSCQFESGRESIIAILAYLTSI